MRLVGVNVNYNAEKNGKRAPLAREDLVCQARALCTVLGRKTKIESFVILIFEPPIRRSEYSFHVAQ